MPYIGNIVQDFSVNTAMLNTDSVTSIKIDDGTIVNADINDSAAIAGSKISPDFGSQNIVTTGDLTVSGGDITLNGTTCLLNFNDTNNDPDFRIQVEAGNFLIEDATNSYADRFVISSGGNIGINNNNPQTSLDVTGAITGTGDLTIDTSTLKVDSTNNRVGIGISSPEEILHVKGNSETVSSRDGVFFQHNTDSDAANTGLPLVWSGRISSGLANYGLASVCGRKENSTGGNGAAYLQFATCDSAGSLTERMRINSSGSVLVGTTSDSIYNDTSGGGFNIKAGGQLVLAKQATSAADPLVWLNDTGQTTNKSIVFAQDGSEKANIGLAGNDLTIVAGSNFLRFSSSGNLGINQAATRELSVHSPNNNNALIHFTNDDTGETSADGILVGLDGNENMVINNQETGKTINFYNGGSERMIINSSGSVGIGTSSPSHALHVVSSGTDTAFFKGRIIRFDGAAASDSPRLNLSLDGTDKAQILLHRTDDSLDITTLTEEAIKFKINSTEKMRVHSSGHVGIGTSSPTAPLHVVNSASSTDAIISNSGNDSRLHIIAGTNQKNSIIRFGDPDDDNRGAIDYDHNGDSLSFRLAGVADRLVFNSQGYAAFSATVPNGNAFLMDNNSSTNPEGLYLRFSFAAPNTSSRHFLKCTDNVGDKAVIDSNGNSRNLNNSYAGFSDISLKENIIDASSQWNDIKNVRVRVFNFKTDSASDKRIGVVAQEIETVCPKLVEEVFDKDSDGNLLETSTKSVKYSVLYMKAIKALQEAQTRIETLEAEVAALKAA